MNRKKLSIYELWKQAYAVVPLKNKNKANDTKTGWIQSVASLYSETHVSMSHKTELTREFC